MMPRLSPVVIYANITSHRQLTVTAVACSPVISMIKAVQTAAAKIPSGSSLAVYDSRNAVALYPPFEISLNATSLY